MDTETLAEARLNLETHLESLQVQQYASEDLQAAREATRLDVHHARQSVQQARQQSHQLALRTKRTNAFVSIKSKSATT